MKSLLNLVLILVVVSCKGGDGGGDESSSLKGANNLVPIGSLVELNGDYNLGQQENYCINYSGNRSASLVVSFSGNTFNMYEYGFLLADCFGAPSYILNGTGAIVKTGDNEILISKVSETGKLVQNSIVADSNSNSMCGINSWVFNQEANISGTSCAFWGNEDFQWTKVHLENGVLTYTNNSGNTHSLYPFKKKSIFDYWSKKADSTYLADFRNKQNNVSFSTTLKTQLSQDWINALNGAGRDTSGLSAGQIFNCTVDVSVSSLGGVFGSIDEIGYIKVNSPNIDTPAYNACLEQDNSSAVSGYNFDEDHLYYIFGEKLYINYFTNSDSGSYLSDEWL
jgi:hypothetical protein